MIGPRFIFTTMGNCSNLHKLSRKGARYSAGCPHRSSVSPSQSRASCCCRVNSSEFLNKICVILAKFSSRRLRHDRNLIENKITEDPLWESVLGPFPGRPPNLDQESRSSGRRAVSEFWPEKLDFSHGLTRETQACDNLHLHSICFMAA